MVEPPKFELLLKFLCPGLLSAGVVLSRLRLSTTLLDALYANGKGNVETFSKKFLARGRKMTLVLNG